MLPNESQGFSLKFTLFSKVNNIFDHGTGNKWNDLKAEREKDISNVTYYWSDNNSRWNFELYSNDKLLLLNNSYEKLDFMTNH